MVKVADELSLQRVLIIFKRRWMILLAIWLVTAAGAGYHAYRQTPLYLPQAAIEIRPEMPTVPWGDNQFSTASQYLWEEYYQTQQNILTSRSLAESTLKALPDDIRKDLEASGDGAGVIQGSVDVQRVRSSFILRLGYIDADPEMATKVVNILANVYIEETNRRMREMKSSTSEALSKETLPELRKKVESAEKKLQEFQIATGFANLEEHYRSLLDARRKMTDRVTAIGIKRTQITSELEALKTYEANAISGIFNPAFHKTPALEMLIQQLALTTEKLSKLDPKDPQVADVRAELIAVESKIKDAVRGTLTALRTDLRAIEEEDKQLTLDLEKFNTQLSDVGRSLSEYKRLEVELEGAKELYGIYMKKYSETTATSGSGLASVRVMDYAKAPTTPYSPNIPRQLAIGAILGLALGLASMLVVDRLNNKILSTEELEAFVGLDVLAVVPRMQGGDKRQPMLVTQDSSMVEFEAFRNLRVQVVTRLEKTKGGKVIAILSALPAEGKSTVTINLAKMLAMEGRKVLIFDADMRNPQMTPFFSRGEGPTLENVLSGEVEFEEAISTSSIPGVSVIGARTGLSSASELASSPRYEQAMKDARKKFDFVLLDSAPVVPVSESALIARRADAAILVVRESRTDRGDVQKAKKRLQAMDVKILGAVLNYASNANSGYGYYYYTKKYYKK